MASPQLQTAIDVLKALIQKPANTPQEMRANFEELAKGTPIPADIKRETVNAGGVPAEWISAPNGSADRAVLYLHGGGYVI
ncbi:MAG: alpha/beta hydrolase, partial [Candidatus Binataceae bacterium]